MAPVTDLIAGFPMHSGGPRSSLDRVRAAVERQQLRIGDSKVDGFKACCPVHDETTPSLNVTWRSGQSGGVVLLFCHACRAPGDQIAEALGLSLADLFDEPLPDRDRSFGRIGKGPDRRQAGQRRGRLGRLPAPIARIAAPALDEAEHQWAEVERYPYVTPDGAVVQEVIREECTAEGEKHKRFRQLFVGADGRRVNRKPEGFHPVLYRAPKVAAAMRENREIWLLEGEKDVHSAERLGLVATTNAQGGKSFPEELVDELACALVHVVLDRDATGWARGVELHAKLTGAGATVVLQLPALDQAKADFTDHLEAGLAVEDLLRVSVEEVATWHALSAVVAKGKALDQAVQEAWARWLLAQEEDKPEDNRRFARRWALETQIRQEALKSLVDQVYGYGMRVGTEWAGMAMEAADDLLTAGTDAARRCHDDVGVAVPASLREPRTREPVLGSSSPEGHSATRSAAASHSEDLPGETGLPTTAPVFRVLNDQIVQWEPDRSSGRSRNDHEDDDESPRRAGKFKVLLSTVVRVTRREYLEAEADHDVEQTELMGRATTSNTKVVARRQLIAVRVQYPDEVTGEQMEIRVSRDEWNDHSWLESLPGNPDYGQKRAELDQLKRAILAVSDDVVDEVLYRATGWRENPDGSYQYIHRRGAITADGHHDIEVAFSGPIERYDLPDPCPDPVRVRDAWLAGSVTMLDRIPARVSAPLLGQVFRAVLGHNPWVLALVGPPGSYKTSLAAKAMQHFGERWEHQRPASSMSGNGDTFNALRFKLHNAKDTLYWMDDFAPTKSWLEAQRHLEETARLIHNQEERSRSSRDGLSVSDGTGPRASGLCTSEVMPRPGSGSERMLVVPLARDDIDTSLLFPLDEPLSRHQRALVMATYISWLARDLKRIRLRYMQIADTYADQLIDRAGESVRQAAALSHAWAGWVAITDFLTDVGAITPEEREQTLRRVDAALREAGQAAIDPDMPRTTGARVKELLAYALRQGIAYVDDVRNGECPPWPLAGRLGWRRTTTELDSYGNATKYRLERNGMRLGYVLHDPDPRERGRVLMCDSTQLEAVLKAAGATQAERLEIDRNTACRALHDEGVLIADESEGRTRHTVKCRIHAEGRTARMVTLYLDQIIGEDDDPADDDLGPQDPGPDGQPDRTGQRVDPGGEDIVPAAIPGLEMDPHEVDEDTTPQHTEQVATRHLCDTGTDQPTEEHDMPQPPTWTSRPYVDRDGVTGWTERLDPDDVAPCAVCGVRCGVVISGLRAHPPCWERTTADERARALARPSSPSPDTSPAGSALGSATANAKATAPATRAARASTLHRAAAGKNEFRAAAAVVGTATIWLSNGEQVPMPGEGPVHVGDLVRLAQWLRLGTRSTDYLTESGQVWVTEELARRLGFDVEAISAAKEQDRDQVARDVTKGSAALTEALQAGYSVGGRGGDGLGRWTRVWKGAEKSVWVVLLPAMTRDDANVALVRGDPQPATLARRIGLLADALGYPYRLSGSTTGLDLMTALRWKDRERFFQVREPVPPARQSNIESDISWCRPPTAEEREHQWVHAYDRSGSYLAGVSRLELGIGEAVHHPDGTRFAAKTPGYWRLEIPERSGDWRMPHPLDPRGTNAGRTRWVTTPGLEFAVERGFTPTILEAYTWDEHIGIFDPWYKRIRDARAQLDLQDPDAQIARDQLKQIYAPTIGMLGSQTHMAGRDGYAPERRHMIIAKARTNILRRVAKIGEETNRWPVAIVADTVLYTSAEADPVSAWPGGEEWMGRELGRYKVEGSARLETQLEFLTGGPYKGKDAIARRVPGAE